MQHCDHKEMPNTWSVLSAWMHFCFLRFVLIKHRRSAGPKELTWFVVRIRYDYKQDHRHCPVASKRALIWAPFCMSLAGDWLNECELFLGTNCLSTWWGKMIIWDEWKRNIKTVCERCVFVGIRWFCLQPKCLHTCNISRETHGEPIYLIVFLRWKFRMAKHSACLLVLLLGSTKLDWCCQWFLIWLTCSHTRRSANRIADWVMFVFCWFGAFFFVDFSERFLGLHECLSMFQCFIDAWAFIQR